jgi:hypothetical protein
VSRSEIGPAGIVARAGAAALAVVLCLTASPRALDDATLDPRRWTTEIDRFLLRRRRISRRFTPIREEFLVG